MSERGYAHGMVGGEKLLVKRRFVPRNVTSHVLLKDLCEEQDGEWQWGVLRCEMLLVEGRALRMRGWDGSVRVERVSR